METTVSSMAAKKRKLLINEKVEVRSLEDGFLGSWHTGTIIDCANLARVVRYDHLLSDQGYGNLSELVKVTPAIDGILGGETGLPYNHRGLIRPLPLPSEMGPWCVHYGQCVDLFHEDAWWEGVIFDHADECKKRRIFFPDLGDEMEGGVEMMRVSLDWNEVTEEWKPRGNWLFLELIEEVERDWPLPVSVKQIWYEVRMRKGFEKLREWTSSGRDIWREIVLRVLFDNLRITAKHIFLELNSSWDEAELGQPLPKFLEKDFNIVTQGIFHNPLAALQIDVNGNHKVQEKKDQAPVSALLTNERALSISNLAILSPNSNEDSGFGSNNYDGTPATRSISKKKGYDWMPAVPELISGPEYYSDIIEECNMFHRFGKCPPDPMRIKANKHLLHLGWKIEFVRDGKNLRRRFTSPCGQIYLSLRLACLSFDHDAQLGSGSQILMTSNYGKETPHDVQLGSGSQILITENYCKETPHDVQLGSGSQILITENYGKEIPMSLSEGTLSSQNSGKSQASSELSEHCTVIEPEFCPKAVMEYYELSLLDKKSFRGGTSKEAKLKAEKAKRHLSAIGWQFYYQPKGTKREIRYQSPAGKIFCSLVTACKTCVEDGSLTSDDFSPDIRRLENVNLVEDFDDHFSMNNSHLPLIAIESKGNLPLENGKFENLQSSCISMSKGLVQSVNVEVCKTKMTRKRGRPSQSPKERKNSRASMRRSEDMNAAADSSILIRRSSKRVRERIASSSQQTPRTVLSWLIDNNVVLPRAKVQYCCRKDGVSKAEGRVAREGIKCGCCGIIFSLCEFEKHAGSSSHRPSAHIFLEGGRSLLDCQLQLRQQLNKRYLRAECVKKGRRHNITNDYICSVCHYGGELLLCDKCPSSFHTGCLGLKEVPEGDWFCLSCCCQICSKSIRPVEGNVEFTDSSELFCVQCEKRYHVECLRNEGINITDNSEGHWFCNNTCKQIFCGLRKILGKKVPVGTQNLTWTLVKCMETDSSNPDKCDDEACVEIYSKLNVALCVMHECFEPVKEPSTRRDLVEDLIFNRWSELNRLNFRGFYTILLEKNDELISAATVRIYGKRVAEIPLVATRFQYRRLGMCRILMNELEKILMELGVERLVLPAIPSVLNTWKYSFGFSEMDKSEQLNFLHYTFLNFQGTIFCQKVLKSSFSPSLPLETRANSCDIVNNNAIIELDKSSSVYEDLEGRQAEDTDIIEQESTCIKTVADNENDICAAQTAIVMHESTLDNDSSFERKSSHECAVGVASDGEGNLKYYKRRRTLIC